MVELQHLAQVSRRFYQYEIDPANLRQLCLTHIIAVASELLPLRNWIATSDPVARVTPDSSVVTARIEFAVFVI